MLRLYDYPISGNCYKIRLLLTQLGEPFARVHVDITRGESRTPAFAAKNPNLKVPVLEWPDGRCLAESNAILFHLAEGTRYLPGDAWRRAQVLQWLFFEQYSLEPSVAVVRFWRISGAIERYHHLLEALMDRGQRALAVLNDHLASSEYLVGSRYSIADIALYAYTHVAHEGGFEMSPYASIRAWLDRVRNQPGHIAITD